MRRLFACIMIVTLLVGMLQIPAPIRALEEGASPQPNGEQADLSSETVTITGTLQTTEANTQQSVAEAVYHTGTTPVPVEVELATASGAVGGLSLYAFHQIPSASNPGQWEYDMEAPPITLNLVPAGGRYVATGYLLPGQSALQISPVLLGGGLTDEGQEPYVTGDLPYTITIRPVSALPLEGLSLDMGQFPVEQAFLRSYDTGSRARFKLAEPGLYRLSAPSVFGHTTVELRSITGEYPNESEAETLRASILAGENYPFYLTAGTWELAISQSKPGALEQPLPTEPDATVSASVNFAPWTEADGEWEFLISQSFNLKVPPSMAGSHLISITAIDSAEFSVGPWYDRQIMAGYTETFVHSLAAGDILSLYGDQARQEGYRIAFRSLDGLGEEPITLQGTVSVDDQYSSEYLSDLSLQMPRSGWYPVQVKSSAEKASFRWGALGFPVHSTDIGGSAPAPLLPVFAYGTPTMEIYPGAPLQATWQLDVGKGQPYPGRTIVLQGQLLPEEHLRLPLLLGIHEQTSVNLQMALDGPSGSYATFELDCGQYSYQCVTGGLLGTDNPNTADEDERIYSNPLEKIYSDSGFLTLTRGDSETGPLSYTISITLPEVPEVVITKADGSGSVKVDGAGPIEVPLGEPIELDARSFSTGLDQNLNVMGRSLNVEWSVTSNGGQASIDRYGRLVAQSAGDVTVTAAYTDDPGIAPATRIIRISEPTPPEVQAFAGMEFFTSGKWILSGNAYVAEPKQVMKLEVRMDGAGAWTELSAPVAQNLGKSYASFSADLDAFFPELAEGKHTFELRATDSVGGMNIGTAEFLFDTTAPVISSVEARHSEDSSGQVVSAPGPLDASQPISLAIAATDMAGLEQGVLNRVEYAFRLTGTSLWSDIGTAYYNWTTGVQNPILWAASNLPNGDYEIRAIAVDGSGNRSDAYVTMYTLVGGIADTAPPENLLLSVNSNVSGYYGQEYKTYLRGTHTFQFQAEDSGIGLASAQLERRLSMGVDTDGQRLWGDWVLIGPEMEYPGLYENWQSEVDLTGLADGLYQFRVVAKDLAGNVAYGTEGYSYSTGIVTAVLADSPPADPAELEASYLPPDEENPAPRVQLIWSPEQVVGWYAVERQVVPQGGQPSDSAWLYVRRANQEEKPSLTEIPDGLSKGTTLYYRVMVVDPFGTYSPGERVTSVVLEPDETPPSLEPALVGGKISGKTVRGKVTIELPYMDNQGVQRVSIQVLNASGTSVATLTANPGAGSGEASVAWDTTGIPDGEYSLNMTARDYWGNESQPLFFNVGVDNNPPEAPASATATVPESMLQVDVAWEASVSEDVASYQLIRIEGAAQTVIATLRADTLSYSDIDGLLPLHRYRYAVRAIDQADNVSIEAANTAEVLVGEDKVAPEVRIPVKRVTKRLQPRPGDNLPVAPVLLSDGNLSTDNVGITSLTWDPGDGYPSLPGRRVTHVYTKAGTYVASLTAKDAAGNTSIGTMIVEILDAAKPSAVLTVKDVDSNLTLTGVTVSVKSSNGTQTLIADEEPLEIYAVPGETVFLSLYKKGYLGSSQELTIPLTGQVPMTAYMKKGELAVGELTTHRLSLDEIKQLGIDITKPENQHVKKFEIKIACRNGDQPCGSGSGGGGGGASGYFNADGESVGPTKNTCKFEEWDPETNTMVEKEYGCFFKLFEPPATGSGGEGGGVALFKIDGEAKWLKEFFRVDALIYNPSDSGFVIQNGRITLDADGLGNGLSLVDTPESETTASVSLPPIDGTKTHQTSWVLRGDKEGSYNIRALFTGNMEFGAGNTAPVRLDMRADEPLKVYGDKAIEQTIIAPAEMIEGELAEIKVLLRNTTEDAPVYGLSLTMIEPHLLEQGAKATQTKDVLLPGETWETVWHLQAPGDSPEDLEGLWGDSGEEELDPVTHPTHFLKGRVVYRPGEGEDLPAEGAIVRVDGRPVARTGPNGEFEAGTDKTGTLNVVVSGGGWRGAWHTTAVVDESSKFVTVEKHPNATADGTGYLISGSLIISLKNSVEALKKNEMHDPMKVAKVEQFALKVLDKGLNGGTESTGPYEQESLRRLHAVTSFMVVNDQSAKQYLATAADSMWDGVIGPISAAIDTLKVGELAMQKIREIPYVQNRKTLDQVLEKGVAEGLDSHIQQARVWAQDQVLRRFSKLSSEMVEGVGQEVASAMKQGLDDAQKQLTAKINELVQSQATIPLEDAAKKAFKDAMLKAYKDGSDRALESALVSAELSMSPDDRIRWWTPDTFGEVSARMADLRRISQELNEKLLDKQRKLIALNTISEILEGVTERSEEVNQVAQGLSALPPAMAVDKATAMLGTISSTAHLVEQALISGPEMIAISMNLVKMTSGPRSLLYINERVAFGAFSQTWEYEKPPEPTTVVSRLSAGALFNFILAPLHADRAGTLKKGGVQVTLRSPADLYVVDSEGRALGIDPATGVEVAVEKRIPGGFYSGPDSEPEVLIVPDPNAELSFAMVGTGDGGEVTLEFTQLGFRPTPLGGETPAEQALLLKETIAAGQKVDFGVRVAEEGASNQAMPKITRNGAALPSLTIVADGPDGAVMAVTEQPMDLSVKMAHGASVKEVMVSLPWDASLLGDAPELTAGTGWTVKTDAVIHDGYLTAELTRSADGDDDAAELFRIRTIPVQTGETFIRLSAPHISLYTIEGDAASKILGLGAEASLIVTDGTVTVAGTVSAFFGGLLGQDEMTGATLSAKEARAKSLLQYNMTAARISPEALVKLWKLDQEGQKIDDLPAYQGQSKDDGRFQITGVMPGEYLLEVALPGLVTRQQRVTLALGNGRLGLIDLLPGDANGDEAIDLYDFVLMQRNLGVLTMVADDALRARLGWLDLNRDGQLTAAEVEQLRPYFNWQAQEQ